MKQFILNRVPDADGIVRLNGKDYHYLVRVRRLEAGSFFSALLPGGEKTEIEVLSVEDGVLTGRRAAKNAAGVPVGNFPTGTPTLPPLVLFQGLPRLSKMDLIVRQAAEGGISVIAPFVSAYSIEKKTENAEKFKRWERIIKEARQQSGSPVATALRPLCTVDGILEYWKELREKEPGTVGIVLHQDPLAEGTFHDYLYGDPPRVVFAVGPEGGFSPAEAERFTAAGLRPLVMGSTILRTETAALYAAAAVRIILLEKTSWAPETKKTI